VAGTVRSLGDERGALGGGTKLRGLGVDEHDPLHLSRQLLERLRLPLPRRVAADDRPLDERARLLRRRKRQALVEEPPEGAAHPCERLCGCGTGGAKRVGVDLDAVAEPGEDDASSRTRAVEVKQQRLAAVAAELVARSELAQP